MVDKDATWFPSPPQAICFSTGVEKAAQEILARPPCEIMGRLIADQESEAILFAGLQLVEARLAHAPEVLPGLRAVAFNPAGQIVIKPLLADLCKRGHCLRPQVIDAIGADLRLRQLVLTERAAIALVGGCWLDTVSQPATQPDPMVNLLFGQHFRCMGEGSIAASSHAVRRDALSRAGVVLPEITDLRFGARAGICDSTALFVGFYIGLSRFAANFLPEVLGVHIAYHALGLDHALFGGTPRIAGHELAAAVDAFENRMMLAENGAAQRERFVRAVAVTVDMEQRHAAILIETAIGAASQTVDARVGQLVARHAKMAGKHHDAIQIARRPMQDYFAGDTPDLQGFMEALRDSPRVRPDRNGACRFLNALKFGGPMFGIFTEDEAALLTQWVAALPGTRDKPVDLRLHGPHDPIAARELGELRASRPQRARTDDRPATDDRELFYRLVNSENFPNTLSQARARAEQGLREARQLYAQGAQGRYTDGRFFPYCPEALAARAESVYENKLIGPYQRLLDIPVREEVVFVQKTYALGNLIDGSWSFRVGNVGRYHWSADAGLLTIYADEMGQGDVRKNHIALIHDVLASMGIVLPHIADPAFQNQSELPDTVYAFAINQLALALFADSHFPEIIGYNLGIEMFGLGELRLHEIQKLRRYGFSTIYEEVHLSIDNISSGHARQSLDIVTGYLEQIRRSCGDAVMHAQWERIWNGYCVFARFIEAGRIDILPAAPAEPSAPAAFGGAQPTTELTI